MGLGSVLSLLLDTGDDGLPIAALEIDDWPRSGLPWIAFWLKELLTWGTLEPVAAYLLARGNAVDRPQAERESEAYYEQLPGDLDNNEKLNPRRIREWLNERGAGVQAARAAGPRPIDVTLARNADAYVEQLLNVMHVETGDGLSWIDGAGYLVAGAPDRAIGLPIRRNINVSWTSPTLASTRLSTYRTFDRILGCRQAMSSRNA